MTSRPATHELEQNDVALPDTGRPVIRAFQGVISSGHYLTSMAGMRILLNGGNAFDALVAAGFLGNALGDAAPTGGQAKKAQAPGKKAAPPTTKLRHGRHEFHLTILHGLR